MSCDLWLLRYCGSGGNFFCYSELISFFLASLFILSRLHFATCFLPLFLPLFLLSLISSHLLSQTLIYHVHCHPTALWTICLRAMSTLPSVNSTHAAITAALTSNSSETGIFQSSSFTESKLYFISFLFEDHCFIFLQCTIFLTALLQSLVKAVIAVVVSPSESLASPSAASQVLSVLSLQLY